MHSSLEWHRTSDDGSIAHISVLSPGAVSLRMALMIDQLPASAELRFYPLAKGGDRENQLLVTGEEILSTIGENRSAAPDNPDATLIWSPTIWGEEIGLEIYLPPQADSAFQESPISTAASRHTSIQKSGAVRKAVKTIWSATWTGSRSENPMLC